MTCSPFVAQRFYDKGNGESRQNEAPPGACFGKSAGALRAGTSVDFSVRNSVNLVFMGSGGGKVAGWQVFRYRRPPKQGVLRAAASKTTMFQGGMFGLQPYSLSSKG